MLSGGGGGEGGDAADLSDAQQGAAALLTSVSWFSRLQRSSQRPRTKITCQNCMQRCKDETPTFLSRGMAGMKSSCW